MAKMSIYISDELKVRMDDRPNVNWSGIAQRAFELQLKSTLKGGDNMSAVVERLRASKAKGEESERPAWLEMGRAWASNDAEYDEFARVGDLEMPVYDYASDPKGQWRLRALTVAIKGYDEIDRGDLSELREMLTGEDNSALPTGKQVEWFVEGAQSVWNEIKDKI